MFNKAVKANGIKQGNKKKKSRYKRLLTTGSL